MPEISNPIKHNPINAEVGEAFTTKDKTYIKELAHTLIFQTATEKLEEDLEKVKPILLLVGAGVFLAGSIVMPSLPRILKPLIKKLDAPDPWGRFNIPYLKRTLARLEKQKLVKVSSHNGQQIVEITDSGRRRILRMSLDTVTITRPRLWNGGWWLVSYDIPEEKNAIREVIKEYLEAWGFYRIQESLYLHAYPCEKEASFLREYLGVGECLRIFKVSKIEQDEPFRKFFGV